MSFEEQELQTSDAQEAPSSEEQTVQDAPEQSSTEARVAPEAKSEAQAPFHEHPRFKELVEHKNRASEEAKALKEQLAEMQRRFESQSQPRQEPKENPLLARLKGIDPEFGEMIAQLHARSMKVEDLEAQLAQTSQENLRSQAATQLNKLHDEYKVPANLREIYQAQIELAALRNPKLGLKDLEPLYKQTHEKYSAILEDTRRTERESYVAGKKADAKTPTSQPKGQTVKSGQAPAKAASPYERKQNMVREITDALRKEKSALGSH